MDTVSIPKPLLYEGPLGIRGECSGGHVPSGLALFPHDLPTPAKVGCKWKSIRQQDTGHVIGSALPGIRLSPIL